MPTYTFECKNCHHDWEELLRIKDINGPKSKPCPACEKIGYVNRTITKSTPVDPVVVSSGKMIDPNLRNTLDQMSNKYPGMKRTIG